MSIISQEELFKIIQNINISKAAGKDNLSGKCLKDGAEILAKPVSEIWNLLITSRDFPNACKVTKLNLFLRKTKRLTYLIIGLVTINFKIFRKGYS